MRGSKEVDFKNIQQPKSAGASPSSNPSLTRVKVDETLKRRRLSSPSARLFHLLLERMNEVSDQKEKPDGHEGSAARTRPTSVEEIMVRRKRKESLENLGAAQLLGNDLVGKVSDYHESRKGDYDESKEVSREEGVENSLRKKEDAISDSREERQDKSREEDSFGAVQLVGNNLVEKVSDYHESEKWNDRSEKPRHGELVNDSSRNKEEAISSSKDEKLDKEGTVGAATLLGNDLGEKVSDDHASEKGNDKSKKVRHEERGKDSSRKKEDATSSSKNEGPDKLRKDDHVEAAQLLGNDLVEKVSDCRASDKELEKSKKVSCESVKDSSRKKEEATSRSREGRLDKPMKKDPVDKVSDYRASGREHDRSKKLRPEERVKDSSKKKEDTISSAREEKSMKDDPVGAAQLLSNDLVEQVSDYHESRRGYHRSEKLRREEDDKDRLRKKVDAISSCREEKLDKSTKKEEPAGHRKRKAEGEGSRAKEKIVEEHSKDRRIKKEETNSSFREERPDKKMKKEDLIANRKIRVEGEFPTTETKTRTDRDGRGVDTRMKANRERPSEKTTEKQIHPQDAGREQGRNALENSAGSRKRLRSLVVADIPRNENSTKPDSGNKRKNQNGDHMTNRERDVSRRHDPTKVHAVEISERSEKREQPKSDRRDMRERRRSRSRDHGGQERQKRSSPLPKAEKATSRHKRGHEDRSENTVKDRAGKHHFNDNDKKSRRYSSSKSELGGYSPRKRREDASAKAASPSNLPSEKKVAKWDLPPTVTSGMFSNSGFSGLQPATQTAYPTMSEVSLTLLKPQIEASFRTPLARQTTSIDSVQLTESTRRMRRLYAENVPVSASEKSLIECFNGYMLSSGSNHIKGSEPCISCIINKEKSQALVEFLTPQDASAALSLDGCSFAGSNLKIRRPKDYVETTSGELEKKEPATNALSDNVEDSSNKIFIGGFPKAISSEMLKEIVGVFGPLKAYRFVINNDLNQRCAFLEYIDGSVTPKACASLNGMKLGGSVITAVCALPDSSSVASDENPPFYGIPEHAKPLLRKPKHILKLKNLVDPEDLPSLSVPEMKEILEDVRLECARFGVIKSINIVKHESKDISVSITDASLNQESKEMNMSVIQEKDEISEKVDDTADNVDSGEVVRSDGSTGADKLCEPCSVTALETISQANKDHDSTEQGNSEKLVGESEAAIPQEEVGSARAQDDAEIPQEEVGSGRAQDEPEIPQEEIGSARAQDEPENPQEVGPARAVKTRWDSGDKIEEEQDPEEVFEPGCIFIEYGRPEATRVAAHSLHGRLYDNKIVKAEYVSKELYKIRFPSG
ncbi:titin homolog isoform X1 [Brassica napus]|uniref:titin homolog isoform X1 n=2 Tax=Brassica napus TaxID=3708 RepID=UPI000BBE7E1E|nr:titin homolog isoform X1 [Brassica napus]